MKKYDTLIFDLDGTLLDTLEDLKDAVNHALKKYGLQERTLDEIRKFVGNGIRNLITKCVYEPYPEDYEEVSENLRSLKSRETDADNMEYSKSAGKNSEGVRSIGEVKPLELAKENYGKNIDERHFEEILEEFRIFYNQNSMNHTKAYDGVYEMLHAVKNEGYKTAILSNKHDEAVKELNIHYFADYIDVAMGSREGIEKKPSADGVFELLRRLGSEVSRSIYIGDSEVDVKTAENAEMACIACLWGFRPKAVLEEAGAYLFADTPEDIVDIVNVLQRASHLK